MNDEQKTEIKIRCLEAAARVFQSFDLSRNESAREITLLAAKQFYEWVTENEVTEEI